MPRTPLARIKAWSGFLKLPIARKTVGILEGAHPSIFKGIGYDFEEFAIYQPGDNPRHIDWKASAKSATPVIRKFRADSNTNMAFIMDSGREMVTRMASGERKIDAARNVCNTFGYLASARLDAVGIIAGDEDRIMNERAHLSFGEVQVMLNKVESISSDFAPHRAFAKVLSYCNQFFNKRTFLVIIFDEANVFHTQDAFVTMIRHLKERHDIFAVSLKSLNPFKDRLPQAKGKVIDISNHDYLPAYFRQGDVARMARKNILDNRKKLNKGLQSIGVPHLNISGTDDFFKQMAQIMTRREVANL